MPKRTDIHKILIIGSGPIVIGQACEFDYSGTQACKALRQEGYEIVLVNSATIMTDPETADITYIEPLTVASVTEIIRWERPDALLLTVGGQTALNLAIALDDAGVLQEYRVEMIGASRDAIRVAENRLLFKQAMDEVGLEMPRGGFAKSLDEAKEIVTQTVIQRSSGLRLRSAEPVVVQLTTRKSLKRLSVADSQLRQSRSC